MQTKEQLEIVLNQIDRVQSFHSRIDGRASLLLAINLAMATVLTINFKTDYFCKVISLPAIVCGILLLISFAYLFLVSYSFTKNTAKRSVLFFGDIASNDCEKFIQLFKFNKVETLLDDALSQLWKNSEIINFKFSCINKAYHVSLIAIAFWLIFLFSITLSGQMPIIVPK